MTMAAAPFAPLTPALARQWADWHEHHADVLEDRVRDLERTTLHGETCEMAMASAQEHRRFAAALRRRAGGEA